MALRKAVTVPSWKQLMSCDLKPDLVLNIGMKLVGQQHTSKIEVQYQNVQRLHMKLGLKIHQLLLIVVSGVVRPMFIFLRKNVQSLTIGVGKGYL